MNGADVTDCIPNKFCAFSDFNRFVNSRHKLFRPFKFY
jgi:hypothetical protein